jgi:putative DNA primase/helicase
VLPVIEPWESELSGAELLDEVTKAIARYVVLPPDTAEVLALWAMHTHCFDCFAYSPRAAITSPEKGCGKTTLLDVLERLVSRPLSTANATVSAIFRIVEQASPTLLIDEADTFLRENDELRGILNTGHRRGGQVLRTVGDDHEPRLFSTWAPAAIAMIGRLPDTLNDRSIIINLRRRKPTEKAKSFRRDRADDLNVLARKMARWAHDHSAQLTDSDPNMGELVNREADNWRPLFAIADAAGEYWPKRVRGIAVAADKTNTEQSVAVLLLQNIRWILDGRPESEAGASVLRGGAAIDRISSANLIEQLIAIEESPWAEWNKGKAITQNGLARMLDRFGIRPGTIRLHTGQTAKGYYSSAFEDVFSRYLVPQTVTPSQPNNDGHFDDFGTVTSERPVTGLNEQICNRDGRCDGVTVATPGLVEEMTLCSDLTSIGDLSGSPAETKYDYNQATPGADSASLEMPARAEPAQWRARI